MKTFNNICGLDRYSVPGTRIYFCTHIEHQYDIICIMITINLNIIYMHTILYRYMYIKYVPDTHF